MDSTYEMAEWLRSLGLDASTFLADGRVKRVKADGKKTKDGWYIAWTVPAPFCLAGDWAKNRRWEWKKAGRPLPAALRASLDRQLAEARARVHAEQAQKQHDASALALETWTQATPVVDHGYLTTKRAPSFGLRGYADVLLIPMRDTDGRLWGLQRIWPNSTKRFLAGQRTKETFFQFGEPVGNAFICEGYATGATIHAATGAAVFCAFSAGNLPAVALALKGKYPGISFVIAGDNDAKEDGTNPGREAAERAAEAIGAPYVLPMMPTGSTGTDFNDLGRAAGLNVVSKQLVPSTAEASDALPRTSNRKPKPGEIQLHYCAMLNGAPGPLSGFPFGHDLRVYRALSGGQPLVLRVYDNTATDVLDADVASYLQRFAEALPDDFADYRLEFEKLRQTVKAWTFSRVDLRRLPKPLAYLSDPEMAMSRLSFDPVAVVDEDELARRAPIFSDMLRRMSNREAFAARLGSIDDQFADRKQAVWVYGPKDCGKSQVAWLVKALTGKGYGILGTTDLRTDWWKAQLVGKRVAVVNEASADFIRSADFKAITGDDEHSVNQKREKIVNVHLPVLLWFFSNDPPLVPHDEALLERIIACRMDGVPDGTAVSETELREKLTAEFPYIAGYCRAVYQPYKHGRIPCSREDLNSAVDSFEADYTDFIEHHFVADPVGSLSRHRLRELCELRFGRDTKHQHYCRRIIENRYGGKFARVRFTNGENVGKRLNMISGIRERDSNEMPIEREKGIRLV